MQEVKINLEDKIVKDAFLNFINNYKSNIAEYINALVGNDGEPCDAEVSVNGEEVTVFRIGPDKGYIIAEAPEGSAVPVTITRYADLGNEMLYFLPEKERICLFYKLPKGEVDLRLGVFKTLNDAIGHFKSEEVTQAIKNAMEHRKAQLKDQKRKQKLGKADAAQVEEASE